MSEKVLLNQAGVALNSEHGPRVTLELDVTEDF